MDEMVKLYEEFSNEISNEFRFILSSKSQDFLQKLLSQGGQQVETLPARTVLYRAQSNSIAAGKTEAATTALPKKRMKPIPNVVSEGRANPSKICVLYLASQIGTALAEVRASTQHPVTVGTFRTKSKLKIVDLTRQMSFHVWLNAEDLIWHRLSDDFSKPLTEFNQSVHYAKTQIIAETFKRNGYDGIRYRSQFRARESEAGLPESDGINYALFDINSASCVSRKVYKIVQQEVVYSECTS